VRFAIYQTEAKLLLLLVSELIFLNPVAMVLMIQFPLFLVLMWILEGGIYLKPVVFYALVLVIAVAVRKSQLGSDKVTVDAPLIEPLSNHPALAQLARRASERVRKAEPRDVHFALSPVSWHPFGVDLGHFERLKPGLPIPLTLLEVWSLSDLEVHVARTAVARRGPSWLLASIEAAVTRLSSEQFQEQHRPSAHWMVRARGRALQRYVDTFRRWRFLVDVDADLKAAQALGPAAVMSLVYAAELADAFVPTFIGSVIEPAIDKGALLPVARSYALYVAAADPHWREAVQTALRENERNPGANASSLVARLSILSAMSDHASFHDPRSAGGLFAELSALERKVAAHELGTERVDAAIEVDAASSVRSSLIPYLRDEVERNPDVLAGKTRFDIPNLLRDKASLAAAYRPDPRFLLAPTQREQRIPYLLGAFLALDLMDEEWDVSFDFGEGIQLCSGPRKIQPFTLVEQLDASTISDAEFADAVR